AQAAPRRRNRWRSRGRWWRGPGGPLDRMTLPLVAVGAATRSRRRRDPGWGTPPLPRVAGPPCSVVSSRTDGRKRCIRTVEYTRCTTRLVSAPRPDPCVRRLTLTRLDEKGEVVKQSKARLDAWADAQRRFHLSDLHIQMARELGLNPKTFGGLANHRQEPWKLPLPEFIAEGYRKRFHRERPTKVGPLAGGTKRQQQSTRAKARHPRARTDT